MIRLSSDDVPTADRVNWFREIAADAILPTWITADRDADFKASTGLLQMGDVCLSVLDSSPIRSDRDRRMIQRSDPERWELALVHSGRMSLSQSGNRVCASPGELFLYDTSRPFDSEVHGVTSVARLTILHLPRQAMPLPEQAPRDLVARPLPSSTGPGALLRQFLDSVTEQMATLNEADVSRLGSAATDLATVFLASLLGSNNTLPVHSRQQVLLRQVKAFIVRNLSEPQLGPSEIAAAHHISVRYLHHLFRTDRQEDGSVGEFIRALRLERCSADLADPRWMDVGVAQIGARWGYRDAATFSRAFKAVYGLSPREYRRQRLGSPVSDEQRRSRDHCGEPVPDVTDRDRPHLNR